MKRHWHRAHCSHINQAHYTRCLSMHAPCKMSHFSTSLSSQDSAVVPCCALFLCLSQSTLLDLTTLSLFITSSFYLSFSDKVHMLSKGVQNSSVFWWKPRGNAVGIAFILLKIGQFFLQQDQAQLFIQFSTNCPTMDFPPLIFHNIFFLYRFVGTMCSV